ncbi:MAG: hypothetical protein ACR2IE_17825 [Candidatus Sumerlaeaceae bacterium]
MTAEVETFDVGDKIKHPKFGNGTVTLRIGDGPDQKVVVKFGGEVGEKKLVVRFANMKKLQERPTLPAAPAAEAATQVVGGAKAAATGSTDTEDEEVELEDEEVEADEEEEEE